MGRPAVSVVPCGAPVGDCLDGRAISAAEVDTVLASARKASDDRRMAPLHGSAYARPWTSPCKRGNAFQFDLCPNHTARVDAERCKSLGLLTRQRGKAQRSVTMMSSSGVAFPTHLADRGNCRGLGCRKGAGWSRSLSSVDQGGGPCASCTVLMCRDNISILRTVWTAVQDSGAAYCFHASVNSESSCKCAS